MYESGRVRRVELAGLSRAGYTRFRFGRGKFDGGGGFILGEEVRIGWVRRVDLAGLSRAGYTRFRFGRGMWGGGGGFILGEEVRIGSGATGGFNRAGTRGRNGGVVWAGHVRWS